MARTGKKYAAGFSEVDRNKFYAPLEALELAKKVAFAKFDETVDVAVKLGVDPRHADQMVRGSVVLPNGTGKTVRVLAFAKGEKAKEAETAGADVVGDDELVAKVEGGWLEFDKVVSTPDMMPKVGKLGRLLGPRGLMPTPKIGTVTNDVAGIVKQLKSGMVEFRVEKAGIVHCIIGKKSFDSAKLYANLKALMDTIVKVKPAASKGVYVRSVAISTTMGPGVKLDTAQLLAEL
ncbi:MAG: 50S ribosomal protein L1 [Deferribacteraceae bacterium]|jgi:large subunit ribosomal protein L1|nr:50S ribosomal protein L1 [Deferribacteraceae bacterium]